MPDYRGSSGSAGTRGGGGGGTPVFDVFPFTPGDFVATATGTPPTLTNNNNVACWSFADGATGEIVTSFSLPASWRSIAVNFAWINPNAGAGDVRWRVALKKLDTGDLASEAFAADQTANVTAGAQNAMALRAGHITGFSTVPGIFGSTYAMLMSRIGADAADTLVGAAQITVPVFQRTG